MAKYESHGVAHNSYISVVNKWDVSFGAKLRPAVSYLAIARAQECIERHSMPSDRGVLGAQHSSHSSVDRMAAC